MFCVSSVDNHGVKELKSVRSQLTFQKDGSFAQNIVDLGGTQYYCRDKESKQRIGEMKDEFEMIRAQNAEIMVNLVFLLFTVRECCIECKKAWLNKQADRMNE